MRIFYTDGSCLKNGSSFNEGGFGVVEVNENDTLISAYSKRNQNTTNNREELRAILYVMLTAGSRSPECAPIVYSDSAYCVNTLNEWVFSWAKNNWLKSDKKTPENLKLIKVYHEWYQKGYRINLKKIKGHAGHKFNELADELATGKKHAEDMWYIEDF